MTEKIQELKKQLENLENSITNELKSNAEKFRYNFSGRKPVFDKETKKEHKKKSVSLFRWFTGSPITYYLSSPFIYALIIPAILLDIFVSIYHSINFRIYGIGLVKRQNYILIDRHRLSYLNIMEKINCMYCGYFNGLLAYVGEIAARTEQFWCPIRHASAGAPRHTRTNKFLAYGDSDYEQRLIQIRDELRLMTSKMNENTSSKTKSRTSL